MGQVHAEAERVIDAAPSEVYAFLADYSKRPQILTDNYTDYAVLSCGKGAGTLFTYRREAAGRVRVDRMRVEETAQGQQLTEREQNSSFVTTWTLTPMENGTKTRVRLSSDWQGATGVKGFFEGMFAPLGLRRIYSEILDKLEAAVVAGATAGAH
ncbi:MAG: SRPBCC family protein [Ktedonobacterales bacterium]